MDFETAKENIQPLPRGRNIKALEMALNAEQSHALQSELMQQRRSYESSILSYEGDDPLELWFEYINWIEQCYPKSGKESALEEILAKCLVTFEAEVKYHQDRRMIKLYIKYIDTQQNPIDYYQELYNQGIGTRVADLYICWAHYYDANDNFEQTEAIFRKGFDAHAEPIDDLKTAHNQFGFSMSQRILYKDDLSKQEFVSKMNERRSALTSLRAHKHKFVGSLRTGVAIRNAEPGKIILKQGESKENCNTANLNVYEDDGGAASESIPQHVSVVKSIIDSTRIQENLREPGLWTKKSTKHQPMFSNDQHQDFDILEDSEEKTPIKENCKVSGIVLPANFARCNLKQSEWNVDLIIEEDSEPLKIPMYNKMYLYKKNMKKDYSIEQLRAYFWYKNNKKKNILTEEMDEHWSNNFDAGIRLPIMFFNKNIPQDTFNPNRYSEPFLQNDCVKLMTLYNEIYPNNSIKEYSLEEILANRIKKGLKKINKSKNIVKNRVTQFVAVDMEETIIQHTDKKTEDETNTPDFKNNEIKIDKRVKQTIDNGNNELKTIKKIIPDESIKINDNIILKNNKPNDELMLPPPIPPKNFENSEKNTKSFSPNDSCSTQTFNFFIKQASISSTPMKQQKAKYSLLPAESHHDSIQQQQPTNQQLDNVSMLPKQLSIIMETTETTTTSSGSSGTSHASTKSSVVSHITNDINTNPSVTMRDDILSTGPIKTFEDKTETVSKLFMSSNEKQNAEDDYALTSNRKVSVHHENAVSSMCPIQTVEDKTETITKYSLKGHYKEETVASSNRCNFVQKEDTASSIRPIQIFEDKTIPKQHNEDDFVLPSNRKGNILHEDTFPSMCPIKIFEDKTETIPKSLIGRLFKQEKEDSIAPYNCNIIQNEDTAPAMRPIQIFEDKTETVPKHLLSNNRKTINIHHNNTDPPMSPIEIFEDKTETIPKMAFGGQTKRYKEDSITPSDRSNFVQKEDTAPSMRPIQIFEDKTETVPKHLLSNNRKTINIHHNNTDPPMSPIEIFEDKTETIPKMAFGGQTKRYKEDSITPSDRSNFVQKEETAPSMRPIQIFEDKTETVPKHLLSNNRKTINIHHNDTDLPMSPIEIFEDKTETIPKMAFGGQTKRYKEDSITPSDRSNFVQKEDTAPSMRPIQIFEDKTETVPKHLLSNNRKTINIHHNDTDLPMSPIEIFEDKTETIPKMAFGGQTKRYKEDSTTPSDRSNFVPKEDTAPSMRPIQIFEDKTEITSKQFMNTKAKQNTENSNGKETALHDNTRLSIYADNTPVKEKEVVKNINKEEMTRNTNIHKTTDHFIDMFTKTPSKSLGAIPKGQKSNTTVNMNNDDINKKPKIFEFVKCNKTRFTEYNNSVDNMIDPLSMKGADSHCNLKSENNSFNSEGINVSISFTDSELYNNCKQNDKESDDENMFDVNKEEDNIMGQSIYITKSQKLLKEKELLILCHNWDENDENDDDDGVIDNNMYMHNENANLNITRQIIDDKLNDNPYPDPYDINLINAFLENIDFINYLQNLTACELVNKLHPLKVAHSININGKNFIIQKIIGKGAYGTIFSGKCQQTGELYAFKQERPANLFEYYICLELHSRLTSPQIKKAFMNIDYSLIGNNASIFLSKLSPYGSLINVCNVIKEKTTHNIDEYIVMMLANQLLLAIDHLHSCNIIHGDIKPDNILLMSKLVYGDYEPIFQFIDFGRGIDMQLFPKNTAFNVKLLTENFICPEMIDGRPWTYQHDLFCLASTVYVLLFGKYMTIEKKQSAWKINPNIPRYYRKSVWENFFEKLLNIPSCNQLPNLQELRDTFKEEIMHKEKYIKEKINQFNNALSNI